MKIKDEAELKDKVAKKIIRSKIICLSLLTLSDIGVALSTS